MELKRVGSRFHWRRVVTGAVLLALFLCLIQNPFEAFSPREVERLKSDDPEAVRRVGYSIAYERQYSVVFIGDSCIYSSVARENSRTIPSYFWTYLAREYPGKHISVYDLSLPGCSFPATCEVARYIMKSHPDLIITDVNPGWFGSSKTPEHLVLRDLNSGRATPLQEITPVPEFPADLYQPWFKKDFSSLRGQPKLGYYRTGDDNPQWTSYRQLADLFQDSPTRALFFLPPRNRDLYQKYNLIDDKLYAERVREIRSVLPSGVLFLDYTWTVESSLFSDLTHMFPDGNKKLARMLARQVAAHDLVD